MKRYAIFSDIDGTLVSFKTHRIPLSTIDALTEAKARGHRFYISTGRPSQFIINLHDIEHLIDGYVSTNGALCYVGETVVARHSIEPADCKTIIDYCNHLQVPLAVVGEKTIAIIRATATMKTLFEGYLGLRMSDYPDDLSAVEGQPILQITPFITVDQERDLFTRLHACTSGRWHPAFTDITHVLADKATGLTAITRHEGFAADATIAFGDGGNDEPIIKAAGIGVAMGNGNDHTKQVADYVTDSVDDDGFAHALRHFGLI